MKKNIILLTLISIAGISNAALHWAYTGTTLGAGYSDGWLVRMYKDIDTNTALSTLVIYNDGTTSSTDDEAVFETSVQLDGANPYFDAPSLITPGFFTAYTVVFNATNFASATQYIIIDSVKKNIGDASDINIAEYYLASNSGTWKNIQAVPKSTPPKIFIIR
jgi:hypothetical protein